MSFHSTEKKAELRELIKRLADKMHERGDEWLLKDCTTREDSWYNRHLKKTAKTSENMPSTTKRERSEGNDNDNDNDNDDDEERLSPSTFLYQALMDLRVVSIFPLHYGIP